MDANEKTLALFSTRVRQLILQFEQTKKERDDFHAQVEERDRKIAALQAEVARLQEDCKSLKLARMIEVSDTDLDSAKKKLAKLIRDVNKCITLLSE